MEICDVGRDEGDGKMIDSVRMEISGWGDLVCSLDELIDYAYSLKEADGDVTNTNKPQRR